MSASHAPRSRFLPRLERLEDRRLLAVSCVVDGSTLIITGDKKPNDVLIKDDGSGTAGNFDETVIDATSCPTAGVVILHVVINTKGGSDTITCSTTGDILAPRDIVADLGGGKDFFFWTETVDDITAGGIFGLDVSGGGGDDSVAIIYSGDLDGVLNMDFAGGTGKDSYEIDVTFSAVSTGYFNSLALGGDDNDDITFDVVNTSGSTALILALLDGGPGTNTCSATANVSVINCT